MLKPHVCWPWSSRHEDFSPATVSHLCQRAEKVSQFVAGSGEDRDALHAWAMGWPSAFQIVIDWLEQPFLA